MQLKRYSKYIINFIISVFYLSLANKNNIGQMKGERNYAEESKG